MKKHIVGIISICLGLIILLTVDPRITFGVILCFLGNELISLSKGGEK